MSTERGVNPTTQESSEITVASKQQLQLQLQPPSVKKIPSVWLLANWLLKERGWPVNNRKKLQLRLLS